MLPKFDKPPVIEVSVGIGFEPLTCWNITAPGSFRELVRSTYPKIAEAPLLPPLDTEPQALAGPQWTVTLQPPVQRTWYLNADEDMLIQLQPDRLHVNWRKLKPEAEYPTYERVSEEFVKAVSQLSGFTDREGVELKPLASEVTYVNMIPEGELWTVLSDLSKVFKEWGSLPGFVHDAVGVECSFRVRSDHASGFLTPEQTLAVTLKTVLNQDQKRGLLLQLTSTSRVEDADLAMAREWCSGGHSDIVRAFTEFTAEEAHKAWERVQ